MSKSRKGKPKTSHSSLPLMNKSLKRYASYSLFCMSGSTLKYMAIQLKCVGKSLTEDLYYGLDKLHKI